MSITLERSARFLILSNVATIAIALFEGWSAPEVMLVYWSQSVVIGFFNVLRITRLGEFSTGGMRMNNRPLQPTPAAKRSVATFFAFHYGLFHLVYFVFLVADGAVPRGADLISFAVCVAGFVVNHAISYRENAAEDLKRRPNIGSMMFFPYVRIIPMHLTIIFGSMFAPDSAWALVLFLSLKTGADVVMHLIEHGKFSLPGRSPAPVE
jgi:hypothetical protein